MKQSTDAKWKLDLSPLARKRLEEWQIAKGFVSRIEGDVIPFTQLNIGILMEFLHDHGVKELHLDSLENPIHEIELSVKEILEQKN